jgi:hypothetical protein
MIKAPAGPGIRLAWHPDLARDEHPSARRRAQLVPAQKRGVPAEQLLKDVL